LLVGATGVVLTAELFHSAFETLLRNWENQSTMPLGPIRDLVAAGAVVATVTAGTIGMLVLASRLAFLFGGNP
jgi:diacylglycerol kinase